MPAKPLLWALVFAIPFMKPAPFYPAAWSDFLCAAALLAWALAVAARRRSFRWSGGYWAILAYLAALVPSLAASPDPALSAFKLGTVAYLAASAVLVDNLVDDEADLRRLFQAWLAATATVSLVSLGALLVFPFAPNAPLVEFAGFHFGSLPPGHDPRLASTFLNANMLCDYLTVSIAMTLVAARLGWISSAVATALLAGSGVAALATISPGLGGVALVAALWLWLANRRDRPLLARASLFAGLGAAALFVLAMALTPLVHRTAPFLIHVPGTPLVLAPSGRMLTWLAAFREWSDHPLLGHGIGIAAVDVRFASPSGLQSLSDAHNAYLNIAAQAGLLGLAGLLVLLGYVLSGSRPLRLEGPGCDLAARWLGATFLVAFAYNGLGGSFEDTRHLWLLLGLFIAAGRLRRADAKIADRSAAPDLVERNLFPPHNGLAADRVAGTNAG